jgi:hypothetical protein
VKSLFFIFLTFVFCARIAWANAPTTAPETKEPDHVAQLKWLDSADADKMVQADIKKGVYRFYVVCGFSCEPAGIGTMDAIQCYPKAGFVEIAGTADTIESDEDARLQEKAIHFSNQYNIQLAEYLSRHGMTDCVVGESWDRAMDMMHKWLSEQDVGGDYVAGAYDKATRKFRFAAYLSPENRENHPENVLCLFAMENHLSGHVIVEMYNRKDSTPLPSIECRYGYKFPSSWSPKPGDYPKDDWQIN